MYIKIGNSAKMELFSSIDNFDNEELFIRIKPNAYSTDEIRTFAKEAKKIEVYEVENAIEPVQTYEFFTDLRSTTVMEESDITAPYTQLVVRRPKVDYNKYEAAMILLGEAE